MTTGARSVTRSAAAMGVATLVSRALGFGRVLVVAGVLGTTYLGNTYQAANSVSNVMFELLAAGALSAVLVPTFVHLFDGVSPPAARPNVDDGTSSAIDRAQRLAGSLLGLSIVVLGAVSIAGVLAAPWLARLLTSGAAAAVRTEQRDLATFLLRFFVPQTVLYGAGAIAIAVLQARRQFSITAIAPIGNTVVTVAFLGLFSVIRAGAAPSLDLSTGAKLCLAAGGTLGVAAFVGIPILWLDRSGFRLRPRFHFDDAGLRAVLRLSGWGVFQHAGVGVLLGAALVVGNGLAGGVVAYQTAFVFFLVPYAVIAQPIHTAMLPELAASVARGDVAALGWSVRWALHAMTVIVAPGAALVVALAHPFVRSIAFGETGATGAQLIAACLAGLAVGLPAYGAFLLMTRAYYALGDSRTPALASLATAVLGAVAMATVAPHFHGPARVAAMGLAHSGASLLAAILLATGLARRTGVPVVAPEVFATSTLAVICGFVAWLVVHATNPSSRLANAGAAAGAGLVSGAMYAVAVRTFMPSRRPVGMGGV